MNHLCLFGQSKYVKNLCGSDKVDLTNSWDEVSVGKTDSKNYFWIFQFCSQSSSSNSPILLNPKPHNNIYASFTRALFLSSNILPCSLSKRFSATENHHHELTQNLSKPCLINMNLAYNYSLNMNIVLDFTKFSSKHGIEEFKKLKP